LVGDALTSEWRELAPVKLPDRLVECVPNFSEGRDPAVVAAIAKAAAGVQGILMLDLQRDIDHNRSVLTFAGSPEAVAEAAVAAAGVAARHIDLNMHDGVHPRIGAADVIPFIPLRGITLEECAALARAAGEQHSKQNGVPVYFYGAAALRNDRTRLEQIRKGGFRILRVAALTDPYRRPDVGGPAMHPTAGASAFGARKFLVAYNVNLKTNDIALARSIAIKIRASSGGFPGVKALGVFLETRNLAQVTTNVTDLDVTPVHAVFNAIRDEAARAGVEVEGSELIGLIPRQALEMAGSTDFRWEHWDDSMVLETRLELAQTGQLRWSEGEFDPGPVSSVEKHT
jgi:glutamate formiminotransferase